jgi:hypothetical protein
MRRLGTVGVLLVAISSFLAFQAMCRPFFLCIERTCEIGGGLKTSLVACVAPEPTETGPSDANGNNCAPHGCRGRGSPSGPRGMDDLDDMDCGGQPAAAKGPGSCAPEVDFASTQSCCESEGLPARRGKCPHRVMSCIYCIPARFIWEPAPLNAVRQSDGVNHPAILATVALTEADRVSRLAHAHSPPGIPPAETGFDRRIAICSFLL